MQRSLGRQFQSFCSNVRLNIQHSFVLIHEINISHMNIFIVEAKSPQCILIFYKLIQENDRFVAVP